MTDAAPTRGRPIQIDREQIARLAIGLFADRGYDSVSMDEIATAAGISRRSLFRHFATKADLVWDGAEPVQLELNRLLARLPHGPVPIDDLIDAIAGSVRALDATTELARTRLKIIASHPELVAVGSPRLQTIGGALETFLTDHEPDPLRRRVVAGAFTATVYEAVKFWAEHTDDPTPERSVRAALEIAARIRP